MPPLVAAMDAADTGQSNNLGLAGWVELNWSMFRAVLFECEVATVLVVVGNVACNQPAGVGFVQYNDMVEELSPEAAYPTFRDSVLPWSSK